MGKLTCNLLPVAVVTAVTSLSTGCGGNKIPLQSFYSANDCAISEQTVKQIKNQKQLDQVMKPRSLFSTSDRTDVTTRIDFEREQLILVAMGNKPTTGYFIDWSNDPATLENGDLHLPVEFRDPPSDRIQAQVITSPCRIFSLPKTEYHHIKLRAIQNGTQIQRP